MSHSGDRQLEHLSGVRPSALVQAKCLLGTNCCIKTAIISRFLSFISGYHQSFPPYLCFFLRFLPISPTSSAPRHSKPLWTPCGTRPWSTTASATRRCRAKLSGENSRGAAQLLLTARRADVRKQRDIKPRCHLSSGCRWATKTSLATMNSLERLGLPWRSWNLTRKRTSVFVWSEWSR